MRLSLLVVFLILAALYESWSLPFSVLLSVPVAIFGAFAGLYLRHFDLDIYAQIGLVMLIGLAAKNAILIVEFARDEMAKGRGVVDAALEGAKLRLRPILMTSFAFILGCVPLAIASGSGAEGRKILGTVVVTGMLAATALAIFLIPILFVMFETIALKLGKATAGETPAHQHVGASRCDGRSPIMVACQLSRNHDPAACPYRLRVHGGTQLSPANRDCSTGLSRRAGQCVPHCRNSSATRNGGTFSRTHNFKR